jgi:hypothetical protein
MRAASLSVCAASSRLGAVLLLAPFAPAMRHAVRRATPNSPLGAALQLTLPPAHGPSPYFLHAAETSNSLQRAIHSRHPPPLSPQRSASAHRTPLTRRWQCESRSDVAACLGQDGQQLGRGTYGGCVVGQDGQRLLRTLYPQVRRLLSRRAASPNPDGRLEHAQLYTAVRCPQHDGGTPWSVPSALRVGLLRPEGVNTMRAPVVKPKRRRPSLKQPPRLYEHSHAATTAWPSSRQGK